MTTDLSPTAISAALRNDLTEQLEAVKARIREIQEELPRLQESQALLERVLAAADVEADGATAILTPREAEPATVGESGTSEQSQGREVETTGTSVPRQRKGTRGSTGKASGATSKSTSGRQATERSQDTIEAPAGDAGAKALTLPERVFAHLIERQEPASVKEITEALFGEPVPAYQNRVRTAVQALVKKGSADRLEQGNGVFYQASEALVSIAAQA